MSIIDLIATGKEAEQLVAQKDSLTQQVADLQNQVDTANLQHTNDQTTISQLNTQVVTLQASLADARAQLANVNALLATDADMIEKQAKDIHQAQMQLAQLNSVILYRDLEWNDWHDNAGAIVGGSGLGTSSELEPDGSGWATFGLIPAQPAPNYYDSYFNKRFSPQPQVKNFELRNTWRFDTLADSNACQCLEMEARQVVNGLMVVIACQLDFTDNSLRFWDAVKKWQPSGKPMPRFLPTQPYEVILAGHRDDVSVSHDSITINGIKTDLTGTSYPAQPTNWGQMIRPALQLDGEKAALAYKVRYQKAALKVW